MARNDTSYRDMRRIHAVILTRNRPDVLARCVQTALSTLGPDDLVTVLDDSSAMISHANAAALSQAARRASAHLIHLWAQQVCDVVAQATDGRSIMWQSRIAPRDISVLRNVALLLSAAVGAKTTVLVDDDICSFDLEVTHRTLGTLSPVSGAVVVGAEINGTTEQDTVTRLSDALRMLKSNVDYPVMRTEELFRVPSGLKSRCADLCGCISAGYMAFRLSSRDLFAFPPGYNEDWLWCLLHGAGRDTRLLWSDQSVLHEPPVLRQSTREDILFELAGDFIVDCLMEVRNGRPTGPELVLEELAEHTPTFSVMPSVRAEEVVAQARALCGNGHVHALAGLESYGLSILGDMLHSGELEMDGSRSLRAWGADAVAKHRSFATTLKTANVWCALRATLEEGRT